MEERLDDQVPPQLSTADQLHVLSFLPPNERALNGRLVSPELRDALSEPQHCTASLSQSLPPHTAPWAVEAGQQHVRQLPFENKLRLMCVAAASGSEVNLEVALALLQPSIFSELWYHGRWLEGMLLRWGFGDPGVAAVQAGHPQLLGWLLHNCPGLLGPNDALAAAAKHCDLAGLQAAWELLQTCPVSARRVSGWRTAAVSQAALTAAAASTTPDAVAKMQWVRSQGVMEPGAAVAAARSGDVCRLQWLRDRCCPMDGEQVLEAALQHADLAMCQWLVDEAVSRLPQPGEPHGLWTVLQREAVKAPDAAAKLQWLHERGAPPLHEAGDDDEVALLFRYAMGAGRVDALQHLRSLLGLTPERDRELLQAAFQRLFPGRVLCLPVLQHLRQAGMELDHEAYEKAELSLASVRWLARDAGCEPSPDTLGYVICFWPQHTPASNGDLLEAVQLLVDEAGCRDWDTPEVVFSAAWRGDLALVQYLLQQRPGYAPGGDVLVAAADCGCEALLEWLVEQHPGCLAGPWRTSAYVAAARQGDRGTLEALRRLDVPWGAENVVARAVQGGCPVPALRWLVGKGAPVGSRQDMERVVRRALQERDLSAEEGAWLRGLVPSSCVIG